MEAQQCVKLTGTNSSIGLIILIARAHHASGAMADLSSRMVAALPLTSGRGAQPCATLGSSPRAGSPAGLAEPSVPERRHGKSTKSSFSKTCASPTWWLQRGGCTRSHSEHGRETPQRRWYFVSRRGRVGRCQVCKTHVNASLHPKRTRNSGTPPGKPFGEAPCHDNALAGKNLQVTRGGAAR